MHLRCTSRGAATTTARRRRHDDDATSSTSEPHYPKCYSRAASPQMLPQLLPRVALPQIPAEPQRRQHDERRHHNGTVRRRGTTLVLWATRGGLVLRATREGRAEDHAGGKTRAVGHAEEDVLWPRSKTTPRRRRHDDGGTTTAAQRRCTGGNMSLETFRWKHFGGNISVETWWKHFGGNISVEDFGGNVLVETFR